jgi:two-component system, LuxR family, sensor kinase FixL
MLVGQLSLLLLVIFAADAAITAWRRGDRRQALVLGGGIVFLASMGTMRAILVFWGIISAPIHSESVSWASSRRWDSN